MANLDGLNAKKESAASESLTKVAAKYRISRASVCRFMKEAAATPARAVVQVLQTFDSAGLKTAA
jgi:DNA-binding phage protein